MRRKLALHWVIPEHCENEGNEEDRLLVLCIPRPDTISLTYAVVKRQISRSATVENTENHLLKLVHNGVEHFEGCCMVRSTQEMDVILSLGFGEG